LQAGRNNTKNAKRKNLFIPLFWDFHFARYIKRMIKAADNKHLTQFNTANIFIKNHSGTILMQRPGRSKAIQ